MAHDRRPGTKDNLIAGDFGGRSSRRSRAQAYTGDLPKRRRASGLAFAAIWGAAALLGGAYGAGLFDATPRPRTAMTVPEPSAPTPETAPETISGPTTNSSTGTGAVRARFASCRYGAGRDCVIDGDTIRLDGRKIRLAGIDAPETYEYRCASEKALGDRATQRLRELLAGGAITLRTIDRDEDVYGRKLRIVLVDGRDVGDRLIAEGLARPYAGGRRPWC